MEEEEFSQDVAPFHGQRIDSVARGALLATNIPSFNFFEETLMCDALVLVESVSSCIAACGKI